MGMSWSINTSPVVYVLLTSWGLALIVGNNKQGLKTEDQKDWNSRFLFILPDDDL